MARIAWINLVDTATLLSGANWQSTLPLASVKLPRLQGLARSQVGSDPYIDLDFGAPKTFDLIALLGLNPWRDGDALYAFGSNVTIGGMDVFVDATTNFIPAGSKIAPNMFLFSTARTCRYLRIYPDPGGNSTPASWDVRRAWVSETLSVDIGDTWAIGCDDPSESNLSDEQVAYVAARKKARYLDFDVLGADPQVAFGYTTPTLHCLAEMDLAIGDTGEVIVAPRMIAPSGVDLRRVILMHTIYGLLRNRTGIRKADDDFFNYSARVKELPSNVA